jgi:tRNA(His) 5'-end guanylyltransferase
MEQKEKQNTGINTSVGVEPLVIKPTRKNGDGLDIGNRMKEYERVSEFILPRRIPVIIRVDGRAFHTITRKRFGKNWSLEFVEQMAVVAKTLVAEIQGCNICYCQSDEISFLLTDYRTVHTSGWFGYDVRKLISISASLAASIFSQLYGKNVCFDSRAFSMPQDEVCNYFIWRQIDATRNAIQMAGREYFSHKELFNKNCNTIQEMLFQKHQINFNDYPVIRKRGFCLVGGSVDYEIPIFTKERNYIEQHVYVRED